MAADIQGFSLSEIVYAFWRVAAEPCTRAQIGCVSCSLFGVRSNGSKDWERGYVVRLLKRLTRDQRHALRDRWLQQAFLIEQDVSSWGVFCSGQHEWADYIFANWCGTRGRKSFYRIYELFAHAVCSAAKSRDRALHAIDYCAEALPAVIQRDVLHDAWRAISRAVVIGRNKGRLELVASNGTVILS